jgi:hypothetical protein
MRQIKFLLRPKGSSSPRYSNSDVFDNWRARILLRPLSADFVAEVGCCRWAVSQFH